MSLSQIRYIIWIICGVVAIASLLYYLSIRMMHPVDAQIQPSLGESFSFTDMEGKPVTASSYRGKIMLIYFGFTRCPDICPTDLGILASALNLLPPAQLEEIAPLFISIDTTDTPEKLKQFVSRFSDRIIGLTGTPEQLQEAASSFKIFFRKMDPSEPGASGSLFEHSAYLFLFDQEGDYITYFPRNTAPAEIAKEITNLL